MSEYDREATEIERLQARVDALEADYEIAVDAWNREIDRNRDSSTMPHINNELYPELMRFMRCIGNIVVVLVSIFAITLVFYAKIYGG